MSIKMLDEKYDLPIEEMITVCIELNRLGLKTVSSCAGHGSSGHPLKREAQLAFKLDGLTVYSSHGIISLNWKRK